MDFFMDFSATNKSDNLTSVIIYEIAHVTIIADSALWFSAIFARQCGDFLYNKQNNTWMHRNMKFISRVDKDIFVNTRNEFHIFAHIILYLFTTYKTIWRTGNGQYGKIRHSQERIRLRESPKQMCLPYNKSSFLTFVRIYCKKIQWYTFIFVELQHDYLYLLPNLTLESMSNLR